MGCDRYWELLSARLDGTLTEQEERELEEHLAACPDCRAAGAQLAALQDAFDELEDITAPEGFTRGVMDRIRAEEKKVVPLFRRPRFRGLAGLAACAVLAVGLYGAAYSQRKSADEKGFDLMVRSFNRDAVTEYAGVSACEALTAGTDDADASMYAAYSAVLETPVSGEREYSAEREIEMQKTAVPEGAVLYEVDSAVPTATAAPVAGAKVLTVERMPEGGWELIPPETPVSPEGMYVTRELLERVEKLAAEQGITASVTSGTEEAEEFVIIVLDETE